MSQNLILLPVFAQVLLTIVVLLLMGRARSHSMKSKRQRLQDLALARDADWDEAALKISNNFKNQFELPVLFYAVAAFALITRSVDVVMLGLAALFVATRVAHTIFHISSNIVLWRGAAYLVGLVALAALWIMLAWRVVASGF
jgi:hypothetical protein